MSKNVGSIDKTFRIIIAIVTFYASFAGMVGSPWNYVLFAVATIMLVTALSERCPLFSIFGISSCQVKERS